MRIIGYERVSTARQGANGLGIEAQRQAIEGYAEQRGATIIARFAEVESGRNPVSPIEEIGTWQQHLAAQRIALPGPGCANRVFGVCDRDFTALFFEHGFAPFSLYAREGGDDWFADPTNATAGS